ncbi:7927_t:CDS:2, partial [Acaulospora colombiana]
FQVFRDTKQNLLTIKQILNWTLMKKAYHQKGDKEYLELCPTPFMKWSSKSPVCNKDHSSSQATTATHVTGHTNPYTLNVTYEIDHTSPPKYHASSDSICPAPQLSTSEAITSSFIGTNSTNTEVDNNFTPLQSNSSQFQLISSWADKAIEEAETDLHSPQL